MAFERKLRNGENLEPDKILFQKRYFTRIKLITNFERNKINRIYISREHADLRRVTNEEKLVDVLKEYGFNKFNIPQINLLAPIFEFSIPINRFTHRPIDPFTDCPTSYFSYKYFSQISKNIPFFKSVLLFIRFNACKEF